MPRALLRRAELRVESSLVARAPPWAAYSPSPVDCQCD
jgi:hypothetical protein